MSEKKEIVGQPVFIAAIVNSFQKKIKLYRNAVLMYDGSPLIANAAASEFLQVGGFSSFTPGYARGTKIYSIEIADREFTQEEIQILYARGVM